MAKAVYPGTFDPVHNGHVDIATRASRLFEHLYIAVYEVPPKRLVFSTDERIEMFRESVGHLPNVEFAPFSSLVTVFAKGVGAAFIVRGLRAGNDFETEFEMAHVWRNLDPKIDVVCMMSALQNQFLHASRIREVAQLGGNVSSLVPDHVTAALDVKLGSA